MSDEQSYAMVYNPVTGQSIRAFGDSAEDALEKLRELLARRCGVCGDVIAEGSPTVYDVEVGTSHAAHPADIKRI